MIVRMTGDDAVDVVNVITLLLDGVPVVTSTPPGLDEIAFEIFELIGLDDMLRILMGVCLGLVLPGALVVDVVFKLIDGELTTPII